MKPCSEAGCPELLEDGGPPRCRVHARAIEHRRGSQRERGYTRSWELRRLRFLQRYPLCGMRPDGRSPIMSRCHEERRPTVATVVDHVAPHGGDLALFWDELNNWQALCAACHARKTAAGL